MGARARTSRKAHVALPARLCLACFTWVLLHAQASVGQTVATTGAIGGKVTDRTGASLPGVTITLSGDALMGTRTAVTSTDRLYG